MVGAEILDANVELCLTASLFSGVVFLELHNLRTTPTEDMMNIASAILGVPWGGVHFVFLLGSAIRAGSPLLWLVVPYFPTFRSPKTSSLY